MYSLVPDMWFSAACFAFILSGVFCGVVRWAHMCHPFDRQGDYFYPARKVVAAAYLCSVLLVPYLLRPSDADAWLYARSFGVIFYPAAFSCLVLRYFSGGGDF